MVYQGSVHFFQSRQLEKLNHKMVARNKIWVQNEKTKKPIIHC